MSIDSLRQAILFLIAFVLCVSVHEFGHAWVANRLGDPTPRSQGRLTLSPIHHISLWGTILIPFFGQLITPPLPLIAWGRPVQYNPLALTRRYKMATGQMLVAVAGPAMNLILAVALSLVMVVAVWLGAPSAVGQALWVYLIQLNLILMCFNLLPIPPLDGGQVLAWVLPRSMQGVVDFLGRWGMAILILLVISPSLGLPLMRWVLYPMALVLQLWAVGLGALLPAH